MSRPLLALLLAACGTPTIDTSHDKGEVADTDAQPGETDPTASATACGAAESVARFTTDDGVDLVADVWPAATAGAPVVVLVHMIPPAWDRTSWPRRVRATLHDAGYTVLNLDRRGAGDSGGTAIDAYEGPGGRLDVQAAVAWLTDAQRDCAVDPSRLALLGASNGTTSVFDYTVAHAAGLPDPAAVSLLSPGTYTENQHTFDGAGDLSVPMLWLYPTHEPYSTAFLDDAPSTWEFVERGTQHGTQMFDQGPLEDATVADLTRFVAAAFAQD